MSFPAYRRILSHDRAHSRPGFDRVGRSFRHFARVHSLVESLAENLEKIRRRIAAACARAGRDPAGVELVAVSKFHPPESVAAAAKLGLSVFGESRIQEAKAKIPLCPERLQWHLIGHLQSNKVRDAVALFPWIQSVDSPELAVEIQKQAEKQARTVQVLLEVNVAGEASKFGWAPARLLEQAPALAALPRLEIQGLMTLAPYASDPERARPFFQRLRELRDQCARLLGRPLPMLSMGMSGDLEIAIEEGSTMIRVGTALFGPRPKLLRPNGDG